MAGAAVGTAHLCTRCPCLLMSSLPQGLRFTARRLAFSPLSSLAASSSSSSLSLSLFRHGASLRGRAGPFTGVLASTRLGLGGIPPQMEPCVRRDLSVRSKVMETADAVMEDKEGGDGVEPVPSSSVPEFRKRLRIADIKGGEDGGLGRVGETMVVRGWVRTCRIQKTFSFIEVIRARRCLVAGALGFAPCVRISGLCDRHIVVLFASRPYITCDAPLIFDTDSWFLLLIAHLTAIQNQSKPVALPLLLCLLALQLCSWSLFILGNPYSLWHLLVYNTNPPTFHACFCFTPSYCWFWCGWLRSF